LIEHDKETDDACSDGYRTTLARAARSGRRSAMLDNMIGDIARAMQDDRRAEAMKQARLVEAEQARLPYAHGVRQRKYRAAIAAALMAFAMRLAPPTSAATPHATQ
jgi:hypothetical protein